MVKAKRTKVPVIDTGNSLSSPLLEINFREPLFTTAAHPTEPILISGLGTGDIFAYRYDLDKLRDCHEKRKFENLQRSLKNSEDSNRGASRKDWSTVDDHADAKVEGIVTLWKTRRHKGSCRSVTFDPLESSLGAYVFSVGKDHIIKKAQTETGKVVSKASAFQSYSDERDAITYLTHSSTHPFLLSGTENGDVLVFDSNRLSSDNLRFDVRGAHDDAVNCILPMPTVSAYHYLCLGSTTLSHIDIRKGLVAQSDNQEDELLSMCYSNECIDSHNNDCVLVGHGEGILSIWKKSKNNFTDQLSRVKVNKNASIEVVMPTMSDDDDNNDCVWCGDSDGLLHRVNFKNGKTVETRIHSVANGKLGVTDEVTMLDLDYRYSLISAGMDSLKIWSGSEGNEPQQTDDEVDNTSDNSITYESNDEDPIPYPEYSQKPTPKEPVQDSFEKSDKVSQILPEVHTLEEGVPFKKKKISKSETRNYVPKKKKAFEHGIHKFEDL